MTMNAVLHPCSLATLSEEPLVSVLLANYNYANYIGQSIESVCKQTYKQWELIICDDGSTDDSVTVINGYLHADPRIRFIRKTNGGHASALNRGFLESKGEVICLLDSDDLYLPNKLASVVESCFARPMAGLITHRVIRVDSALRRLGVWPLSDAVDGWLGPDLLKTGGILAYAPPTSGISLRRAAAEMLFPLSIDPPLHMCPDQVIMRLAPLITAIKRIPEALAEYRLHDANTYSRRTTSGESVSRELALSTALWNEQRRHLKAMHSDFVKQLTELDCNSYIALLEYIKAKLLGKPDVERRHMRYLTICEHEHDKRFFHFWRASFYLPNIVFIPMLNLLFGQGYLKQLLSRIKSLV
jgi:glycosyltransferase involved in cell wall biosynthesis